MAYTPPEKEQLFPILGHNERPSNWASINLETCRSFDLKTHKGLEDCIDSQLQQQKASIGYGGYLEERSIYLRSDHFSTDEELRNIHLGCDIWGPVGQAVFAPLEGRVHSFAYNEAPFDYGATHYRALLAEWTVLCSLRPHTKRRYFRPGYGQFDC